MRDIKGFEGIYAVTEDGKVWSHKRKKFMKDVHGNHDYRQICLRKGGKGHMCYIHRLVALTYIDNPDNLPQVNHKDENKANNHVSNLEWADSKYNVNYGTRTEKARLNDSRNKKVYCVELDKEYFSVAEAIRQTGLRGIYRCVHGKLKTSGGYHWKYV